MIHIQLNSLRKLVMGYLITAERFFTFLDFALFDIFLFHQYNHLLVHTGIKEAMKLNLSNLCNFLKFQYTSKPYPLGTYHCIV